MISLVDAQNLEAVIGLFEAQLQEHGITMSSSLTCGRELAADMLVLAGDILARVLSHKQRRHEPNHRTDRNVDCDRRAGFVSRQQCSGYQGRRPTGDDRRKLIAYRGAAVPHPRRKLLGDQRSLRSVHRRMRDRPEQDANDNERRVFRREQTKEEKSNDEIDARASQVHPFTTDPVRKISRQRDSEELEHGERDDRVEQEVTAHLQVPYSVGKDKGRKNIKWRLLGEPSER
jgi:hypothetical protein